jgi:outer membrane protein TolC
MRPLAILLLSAALANAQRTLPLSLKRAVEIALAPEGSPRVALAEESIKQAEMRAAEARAAFLPDLETSVQDRRQTTNLHAFGLNFPTPPGFSFPSIVGPFNVFDARATAQQSVFDFSSIRKYQASRAGVAATKADFDATRNQVSDQVARAYLACLREDATLETARANVELSEALLKLAQSQKSAGTGTGIEVTRAQVQLANDRQRLIFTENERRRAVLQLLKTMGLKLDSEVNLTDKLVYQPADVLGLEALLEKARKARAELKAQQQRQETARLNYGGVKAERLPSVASFADYGSIGMGLVGAQPTYTYGISLKVPVFDGGKRDARRAESLSQYRQEQVRTRDLEDQIELEVRLALDSLRSAMSQVETAREGLTLAENELAQARRRYQAGVTNSIEVTDAQTRLDRARDNHIAALYNYNLARLDLATATGSIEEYVTQ